MNRKVLAFLMAFIIPSNFYGSVDFDGTDDYFDCGFVTVPDTSFTIAAWIKINTGASIRQMHVISLGTSDLPEIQLSVDAAVSEPTKFATYCTIYSPDSGGTISQLADCPVGYCITPGQWHHIACTNDGGEMVPFIDGIPYTAKATGGLNGGASVNLLMANDVFLAASYFYGEINDPVFFNTELSLSEIQTMAFSRMRNTIIPTDSLSRKQFYFPLDDFPDGTSVSGRNFIDRTGLGNACTGTNGGTSRADILRYP